MAKRTPQEEFDAIKGLLGGLARLFARGMSADKRARLWSSTSTEPIPCDPDELAIFLSLLQQYELNEDAHFAIDALRLVEADDLFEEFRPLHEQLRRDVERYTAPPKVFVLMPFEESIRKTYEFAIRSALESIGCKVERADESRSTGPIADMVFKRIRSAHFLVADVTGQNANVIYELGYAHAVEKNVILIRQDLEKIPFFINGHNVISYSENDLEALRLELTMSAELILKSDPGYAAAFQ